MSSWYEIRRRILNRDGYTCKVYGKKPSGQLHHILERSKGGGNEDSNLMTLCGRCHMLVSPIPEYVLIKVLRLSPDQLNSEKKRIGELIKEKTKF